MSAKTINSTSKIDALVEFAKSLDESKFLRTQLALTQNSYIINAIDTNTFFFIGTNTAGETSVIEECERFNTIHVPNAENHLRSIISGIEERCRRAKEFDGLTNDPLEVIKKSSSDCRKIAEAAARLAVVMAEQKKLQRICDGHTQKEEKAKDTARNHNLWLGCGKRNSTGAFIQIDGMSVVEGKIPAMDDMPVVDYLAKCREKKAADRQRRIAADKAAQKAKESAATAA